MVSMMGHLSATRPTTQSPFLIIIITWSSRIGRSALSKAQAMPAFKQRHRFGVTAFV